MNSIYCNIAIFMLLFSSSIFSQTINKDTIDIRKPLFHNVNGEIIDIKVFNDSLRTGKYIFSSQVDNDITKLTLKLKQPDVKSLIGKKIPPISFTNLEGKLCNIANGTQKVLCFWEMHCAPCIKELIVINTLADDFKNFEFFALTPNSPAELNTFFNHKNFRWDNICIFPEFRDNYNLDIYAYPVTIIIDKENIIRKVFLSNSVIEILVYLKSESNI